MGAGRLGRHTGGVRARTWRNRSYGRDSDGVPLSSTARAARRAAAAHASVCGESAWRALVVRRLWDSSMMTTPHGSAAMQWAGGGVGYGGGATAGKD